VGPGSLGIGPYLKQAFTGVDVDFTGPQWPAMTQKIGKAEKLPFENKSFDSSTDINHNHLWDCPFGI